MTHDEVSKACVPTALRAASDLEIDGIYNAAHSHLRGTDDGVIRQMQACISAIAAERIRRQNKLPIRLSVLALVVSAASLALAVWLAFRPPPPQKQQTPPPLPTIESKP